MSNLYTKYKLLSFLCFIIAIGAAFIFATYGIKTFTEHTGSIAYDTPTTFTIDKDLTYLLMYDKDYDSNYDYDRDGTSSLLVITDQEFWSNSYETVKIQLKNLETDQYYYFESVDNPGSTSVNEYTSIGKVILDQGTYEITISKVQVFNQSGTFKLFDSNLAFFIIAFVFSLIGFIGSTIVGSILFAKAKSLKYKAQTHNTDYQSNEDLYDFNQDPFAKYDN